MQEVEIGERSAFKGNHDESKVRVRSVVVMVSEGYSVICTMYGFAFGREEIEISLLRMRGVRASCWGGQSWP